MSLIGLSGRLVTLLIISAVALGAAAPSAFAAAEVYFPKKTAGPDKGGKAPLREVGENQGEAWIGSACINEYYPETGKRVFPKNTCGGNEVVEKDDILELREGPKPVIAQVWNSAGFACEIWGWESYA